MAPKADFDLAAAHKYFAAHCFNTSWALMDHKARTVQDAEQLIALGHASLWHWTQRADCTPKNLSVAHWLLSRIYAVLGDSPMAQRYAGSCLRISVEGNLAPLLLAYAHEALARAAMIVREWDDVAENLQRADELAEQVTDPNERELLTDDLTSVRDALTAAQNEHS